MTPARHGAHDIPSAHHVPAREWYARPVLDVARDLLGAFLTTRADDGVVTLRITEVEAYAGQRDPGSHAFRGPTPRNAVMFEEPGRLYVYRHMGLHHCANIVCEPAGTGAGVLLRAGEVVAGVDLARARRLASGVVPSDVEIARGPARLTVALGIDMTDYGLEVTRRRGRVVLHRPGRPRAAVPVATGARVGVSGAGGDPALFPWRFWLADDPTVSAYRPAAGPRRPGRPRSTSQARSR